MQAFTLDKASSGRVTRAIMSNAIDGCKAWTAWDGMALHHDRGLVWTETRVKAPMFNNIFRFRVRPDQVDAVLARLKAERIPLRCWVGPDTSPSNLGERLLADGWTLRFSGSGMAANLDTLPESVPHPPDLRIERVDNPSTLNEWAAIFSQTFSLSEAIRQTWYDIHAAMMITNQPWQHYLARLNGVPVAMASLFFGCGVAGVANVTTLPMVRNSGIGTAITLRPLQDAQAMGYKTSTLIATPMAQKLYSQLGFRKYCQCSFYIWNGTVENNG